MCSTVLTVRHFMLSNGIADLALFLSQRTEFLPSASDPTMHGMCLEFPKVSRGKKRLMTRTPKLLIAAPVSMRLQVQRAKELEKLPPAPECICSSIAEQQVLSSKRDMCSHSFRVFPKVCPKLKALKAKICKPHSHRVLCKARPFKLKPHIARELCCDLQIRGNMSMIPRPSYGAIVSS